MTKKRLFSIFLTALLFFTVLIPVSAEVSAAKAKIIGMASDEIIVESGRQFYFGDMISVEMDKKSFDPPLNLPPEDELRFYTATEMGAIYVSDHPEVMAVEEKSGYAQAKTPGTANITVSCHGSCASFPVTVTEKKTLCGTLRPGKKDMAGKLDAAGRKLAKKIPQKLTPENGYELIRALKTYLAAFENYNSTYEADSLSYQHMLCGWSPDRSFRMAPACSCYIRAHSMILRYIRKYHIMHDKRYWTADKGQYFTVSATTNQITLKMKKKLTKQALLALYLEEIICEIDYLNGPPVINTTVQKDCLKARSFINKYKDTDKRYLGHTVTLFKLGSKTATVTHVYRTRYNPSNGEFKFHHKKKLALKKGKKYSLRINTLDLYWPGKFIVK